MQPVETVYLSIYYMVMDRPHGRKAGEYDCRYDRRKWILLQGRGRPYYVDVNQNMKRVWVMFM